MDDITNLSFDVKKTDDETSGSMNNLLSYANISSPLLGFPSVPLQQVDIYTINGRLLQRWTNILPSTVNTMNLPGETIIMCIKLTTGEYLIRKLY